MCERKKEKGFRVRKRKKKKGEGEKTNKAGSEKKKRVLKPKSQAFEETFRESNVD